MPDFLIYNLPAIISGLQSEPTDPGQDNFDEECEDFYTRVSRSYHKQTQNPGGNDPSSNKYLYEVEPLPFPLPQSAWAISVS